VKIISIDAGNTHLRVAKCETKSEIICSFDHITRENFTAYFNDLFTNISKSTPIVISTVTNSVKKWIPEKLQESGHIGELIWTQNSGNIRIKNCYSDTIGIDRMVDAIAATNRYPNEDLIVIDSGTATTIDFITKESVLLGGYILPGIGLKAKVITEGTDKLPSIDPYNLHIETPPVDTISAIAGGLLLDSAGGIEKAITAGEKLLNAPRIIACGGGWEIIGPYVEREVIEELDLTLWGTALLGEDMIRLKQMKKGE